MLQSESLTGLQQVVEERSVQLLNQEERIHQRDDLMTKVKQAVAQGPTAAPFFRIMRLADNIIVLNSVTFGFTLYPFQFQDTEMISTFSLCQRAILTAFSFNINPSGHLLQLAIPTKYLDNDTVNRSLPKTEARPALISTR